LKHKIECYVHGLIDGEAPEYEEDGTVKKEEFILA
jgi:hypothetical protein